MQISRNKIIGEARSWLDVRFRHQGRSRIHGVDCAGLIIVVAKALNISEFDIADYRREPKRDEFVNHFRNNMIEKNIADRKPGDVILIRDKMFTCHSVIFNIDQGQEIIIHAFASRKKVVEESYSDDWKRRTTQCFSYIGVED